MSVRSYLDHNATSPLRPEAREAMIDALDCAGNPSSLHAEGREARAIVENARETVAQIFQVMPQAVTFTSGDTEAANWLLQHRDGLKLALSAVEHPFVLKGHRCSRHPCLARGHCRARSTGRGVVLSCNRRGAGRE
ncbi:MAG: aminotransferase class V-fold PLP-dependent enzyme [Roseiarcus sp.]